MRVLLRLFLGLSLLLGGFAPVVSASEPPAACCCGDEGPCPCPPPATPIAPRCPQACPPARVATAPQRAAQSERTRAKEATPQPHWVGATTNPGHCTRPAPLADPPDGRRRLALLSTLRN